MTHTKEPWRVDGMDSVLSTIFVCADGELVGSAETKFDARRIVACVNACAGIDTPDLEVGMPRFIEMMKEREELLAALEGVLPFVTGNYWPGVEADAAVDFAVATARKVGADKTAEVAA